MNEEGRKARKYAEWEKMLAGRVYVCDVVLTNTTAAQRSMEVLMQVPGRSIVLQRGSATRTRSVVPGAYGTQTVSYVVYFPESGEFVHYPALVAMRGGGVCVLQPRGNAPGEGGSRSRVQKVREEEKVETLDPFVRTGFKDCRAALMNESRWLNAEDGDSSGLMLTLVALNIF
ncbi:uncharacterized protein MONOS_7858 [Monocercomonoides exilis]|uniref:uncharacterized protein n=1 Tax=Monocercomonoides exilis TaxID=2049356 RepID=UPI003559B724|nr:hypothetical protein MONOS_7858 [Monocercomonoides exilis]